MTLNVPAELVAALASRYDVQSVLGRGGMATVYKADDRKHRRPVAIKVLSPDLALSVGAERFLKEIEIVAQLTHPHILALHDSGEAHGLVYYVMPYIEGGSLRQRLVAGREHGVAAALALVTPIADALSYAHRMGVLHRDIKPENILFSQGHPVVADFGIAKAVSAAAVENTTRTGMALGTPGYMSPEQAAGLRDVDERTDVYSLAVVIYEMIVGEIPGRWPSEDAVRAGRFLEAPTAHRARLDAVGPRVEHALIRALGTHQDQRTASPRQFVAELTGREELPVPPRRRYSAEEVDAIVRRASELEARNPTMTGAMTIGGVEEVAREVGIAPALVRSAAGALDVRHGGAAPPMQLSERSVVAGGATNIVFERVLVGELDERDFSFVVDDIRRFFQHAGQVSQLGRTFTWVTTRGGGGQRDVEISVSVRNGQTRLTVRENLAPLIGKVFGGICGGMGGGGMGPIVGVTIGAMHLHPLALLVVIPLWIGTAYSVARTTFHYASLRRERKLEVVVDLVAEVITQLIDQPSR